MEKPLNCTLLLSLQEMALRKVAVLLWSDSDVLSIAVKSPHNKMLKDVDRWIETFKDKVKGKVLKLLLPESLQKQMLNRVEPIGAGIREWKKRFLIFYAGGNQDGLHGLVKQILNRVEPIGADKRKRRMRPVIFNVFGHQDGSVKLCFTTAGAVDYKKSAEELVRWKKLDVDVRYKLACEYCLEDYIPILWKELPGEKRLVYSRIFKPGLLFCWSRILKGELSEMNTFLNLSNRNVTSFNQWTFEHTAKNCNKTAAEYFFLKLTHEEREVSLMRTVHFLLERPTLLSKYVDRYSGLLCYLLSLLTPEQQMVTIKAHPVQVLLSFFYWPLQDLLVENASIIWPFIPPSRYDDFLYQLDITCEKSGLPNYFPEVFKEFYMHSPFDFKRYFAHELSECRYSPANCFLRTFFNSGDPESIEVLFGSLDAADRVKFVFNTDVLFILHQNILMQRWNMVEVCLRNANLSKEDKMRLKRQFLGCDFIKSDSWENRTFIRFLEFLDKADASAAFQIKGQKH